VEVVIIDEKKRIRRYREKRPQLFIAGVNKNHRIHDFLKGWGTVYKDNSILWDTWRPLTKRQVDRVRRNHERFRKNPIILFPIVKTIIPILNAIDIINVQPMKV
jgi:hypothetical protein